MLGVEEVLKTRGAGFSGEEISGGMISPVPNRTSSISPIKSFSLRLVTACSASSPDAKCCKYHPYI